METQTKGVAWYDFGKPGWLRDILILLHLPYSAWHLSYVLIGAALAPKMNWSLLGWTILAFALAMCICGHVLDELNGRPLKTNLPKQLLWGIALTSMAGAVAIGAIVGVRETIWIIPCIFFGGFITLAYNLEWGKAFFHQDYWFGIAWGAFPVITAYIVQTHTLTIEAILVAVFALLYSMAQRVISTQARFFRRKVSLVGGSYFLEREMPVVPGYDKDKKAHPITKDTIIGPADLALKFMTWAVVAFALGLLMMHLMRGGL